MFGYTTERIKLLAMDIKKLIKKIVNFSCVYFTIITTCYMLILQLANIGDNAAAVEAFRVLLYFFASVLLAIANVLYSIKKIPTPARIFIHYIICLFAFYTCFLLPVNMRSSFMFTGIVIFSVIYFAIINFSFLSIPKFLNFSISNTLSILFSFSYVFYFFYNFIIWFN